MAQHEPRPAAKVATTATQTAGRLQSPSSPAGASPICSVPALAGAPGHQTAAALQPAAPENPAPWQDYQTVFTNAKAGMDGVDKAHVQKIVYEMSKDSAHFRNEQRKQAQLEERIRQLRARSEAITPADLAAATKSVDARIASLESRRDLTRTWLHADMDCFYAAVHERERPELKRLPVAIGGLSMISTANYVARKFGVRSAMPGFIAKRLCPQLVFVPLDFKKYTAAAEEVRAVLRQFDPEFESGGLDEAYLDITDYCQRNGCSGEEAAAELRRRVRESCGGLSCSCGVAPNKMLAKICSDINKPDGQYVLPPSRSAVITFMDTLPARKIPCIGKVTEQLLRGVLGVSCCGQLLGPQRGRLPLLFSETAAGFFLEAAMGLAATRHAQKADTSQEPGRKGISCERTFRNMADPRQQETMATQLVESLASDMAAEELEGRNLTLKLKLSTFEVRTRAATLPRHVRTAIDMLPTVLRLLRSEGTLELRLMGVRMAALRKVNSATRSPLARLLGLRPNRQVGAGPASEAGTGTAAAAAAAAGGAAGAAADTGPAGRAAAGAGAGTGAAGSRPQPRQPASAPPLGVSTSPWGPGGSHTEPGAGATACAPRAAGGGGGGAVPGAAAGSPRVTAARTTEPGGSPQGRGWRGGGQGGKIGGCIGCGGGSGVISSGGGGVDARADAWHQGAAGGRGHVLEGAEEAALTPRAGAAGAGSWGNAFAAGRGVVGEDAFWWRNDGAWSHDVYGELQGAGLDELQGYDVAIDKLGKEEEEDLEGVELLGGHDPQVGWRCDEDGDGYHGDEDPNNPWVGPWRGMEEGAAAAQHPAKRRRLDVSGGPGAAGARAPLAAADADTDGAITEWRCRDDGGCSGGRASAPMSRLPELAAVSIPPGITGRRLTHVQQQQQQQVQQQQAAAPGGATCRAAASAAAATGPPGNLTCAAPMAATAAPEAAALAAFADEVVKATGGDSWERAAEVRNSPAARGNSGGSGGGGGGGVSASGAPSTAPLGTGTGTWTCRVCTFAHNRRQLLRCEVCDCLRGCTQLPPPPPPQTDWQPPPQQPQKRPADLQHRRRGSSGDDPGRTIAGGGGAAGARAAGRAGRGGAHGAEARPRGTQSGQRGLQQLWASAATAAVPKPVTTTTAAHTGAGRPPRSSALPPAPQRQQQQHPQQQQQQHPSSPSAAGPSRPCPQCGAAVAAGRWVEHQDWHLAVRLSREGTA